jgi:hypothetical protein
MKKIIIIIAIVLILPFIAAAIFVATFDADRYKGALIKKLEESTGKNISIDHLSLGLLNGLEVKAKGVAMKERSQSWSNPLLKAENLTISVEILPLLKKDIRIRKLSVPELKVSPGNKPSFRCGLDLNVNILINSASQSDMLKTLTAKGNIKLQNAALENMNVLKTALDKLNMLPGLVQNLKDNLPEQYKGLLSQDYTAFKPISAGFQIKDARIYFDELTVESQAFYLTGKGSVGMIEQDLDMSADLFIQKDLSSAFVNTVPEFKYLLNDKGVITMPLEINGRAPNILVMPDLEYIMQKLFVSKGRELLNRFLGGK